MSSRQRWHGRGREVKRRLQPIDRFVREYTGGLRANDLQRLFDRDASIAYRVLTRDQSQPPATAKGLGLLWYRVRTVFLGLSYRLTPARRSLFAVAILCAVLGIIRYDLVLPGGGLQLDDSPVWFLLGFLLLLYLLCLELVDRVRVRDELEIARQLQRDLLPAAAPDLPGYRWAFSYRTANEVGGDYYDFFPLHDGRLAVVAGDASGHGIAAGLLMAIANASLRLALTLESSPEGIVKLLNRVLYHTGGKRAFMTLFIGLLDPERGYLEHVCAGHPFPMLRRADGRVEEIGSGCLPVGIRSELRVTASRTELHPGDTLVLYSDGIPEAVRHSTGADFGFERLQRLVEIGGTPQQLHDRIIAALDAFLRGEPCSDDVSLVVIGRDPPLPPVPGGGQTGDPAGG